MMPPSFDAHFWQDSDQRSALLVALHRVQQPLADVLVEGAPPMQEGAEIDRIGDWVADLCGRLTPFELATAPANPYANGVRHGIGNPCFPPMNARCEGIQYRPFRETQQAPPAPS